ncbi:MAG: nitrogen fixation protein NifX [Candidatus Nitrospinota bacterium M3_3B_026]
MKVIARLTTPAVAEGALRVAFATSDGVNVDEHFGWGANFVLYDISRDGFSKAGRIIFDGAGLDEKGNDNKLAAKIDALEGCHIVYSSAIGGPAAARLTRRKIQPMIASEERAIVRLCSQVMDVLKGPAPPWLAKIVRKDDPDRFHSYDDDDE